MTDTLTLSQKLRESGMERRQAEALAAIMGTLATKSDIHGLRLDARSDVQVLSARVDDGFREAAGKINALADALSQLRAEMGKLETRATMAISGDGASLVLVIALLVKIAFYPA